MSALPKADTGRPAAPFPSSAVTQRLSGIVYEDAGLSISSEKSDFFGQRVGRRLRHLGIDRYETYIAFVESREGHAERRCLVEALTTHTTAFFREQRHYDFMLSTGLDNLVALGAGRLRPLRVWSAACSNGAELYSAMIVCREYMARSGQTLRVEGIGTDISRPIIRQAEYAVYAQDEISGLNEDRRRRNLLRDRYGKPRFRVEQDLRRMCSWSLANLTDPSPAGPREIDVAFLRNVLIYFDRETQARVARTIVARLRPGGYLFTGHSEPLSVLPDSLVHVESSIYRKEPD